MSKELKPWEIVARTNQLYEKIWQVQCQAEEKIKKLNLKIKNLNSKYERL